MTDGGTTTATESMRARPMAAWVFTGSIAVLAVAAVVLSSGGDPHSQAFPLPWMAMVLLYWLGESVTVHFRFRREAHTFSLGEVALVLGLVYAAPQDHLVGQAIGTLLACAVIRRQSALKVVFNVAQMALQSVAGIVVFRAIAEPGSLGPREWLAILAAVWVGVLVGEALINVVIRLVGTRLSVAEVIQAFLGLMTGVTMIAAMTLVGAIAISADRRAAWIALSAPVLLFLAYRMYAQERHEGARLDALYEASRLFSATPHLEDSLRSAVSWASERFEVATAVVVVFSSGNESASVTGVHSGVDATWHRELLGSDDEGAMRDLIGNGGARVLDGVRLVGDLSPDGVLAIRVGMVAPFGPSGDPLGVVVVANPMSEVQRFDARDLQLLSTTASLLATAVVNGRLYGQLEQSLEEMTALRWELEATVESKNDLIASVSHELRTPLTAVVGLSEELRDRGTSFEPEEAAGLLSVIADQSRDLSDLIDDLLIAARLDVDSLGLVPEPVDAREQVDSVVGALSHGHHRTPLPSVVVVGESPPVLADPLRLRQILRNLLINASQYGGPSVVVRIECRDGMSTITVIDDGDGVPEGFAERIFGSYERAGQSPSQPGSVGLGLAVSRRLARWMGGELRYLRSDGETAFELELPLSEAVFAQT